jgi:hypothetical protein
VAGRLGTPQLRMCGAIRSYYRERVDATCLISPSGLSLRSNTTYCQFSMGSVTCRRLQGACAGLGGLAFFTAAASAQNLQSVWDLNGSQLYLSTSGVQREFRYHTVRSGLQDAGVQIGTVWFQGTRSGNQYSGTAYVFSKSCGAISYGITGSISKDERTITFKGSVPSVSGDDCALVGYHDDTDVLRLLETSALQDGEAQSYGDDGRLFSSGDDDYFLLSRMTKNEGEIPGYAGQVRVVHHFSGKGYEILVKDYSVTCAPEGTPSTVNWFKAGDHTAPINVSIKKPSEAPKQNVKESYNLYWAVCFEKFKKFQ